MKKIRNTLIVLATVAALAGGTAVNSIAATVDLPEVFSDLSPIIEVILKIVEFISKIFSFIS